MDHTLISPLTAPLYALSGLLVGVLVGMTGIGGGSLMTPLLVFVFGFDPKVAVGTEAIVQFEFAFSALNQSAI